MTQMAWSALQGTFSLFKEENRADFIAMLEKGTIQEGVISQATYGPVMMLSLFHDLQNPLFKRSKFDVTEFLQGVAPALENFHNVSGLLESELDRIMAEAAVDDTRKGERGGTIESTAKPDDTIAGADYKDELETVLTSFPFAGLSETANRKANAVLNHEWIDLARKDPESLAAQLSRMVTKELFHIHQISAKTTALLQNRNMGFREGSCTVNNVALLSARAGLFVEREGTEEENAAGPRYVALDDDHGEGNTNAKTAIAAQMEVLYDLTHELIVQPHLTKNAQAVESSLKSNEEPRRATIVSVATLEGWLMGGPDGELRWKLALYRPAFEFPTIEGAY